MSAGDKLHLKTVLIKFSLVILLVFLKLSLVSSLGIHVPVTCMVYVEPSFPLLCYNCNVLCVMLCVMLWKSACLYPNKDL